MAGLHRFDGWPDVVAHGGRPVDPAFEAAADAIVAGDAPALRAVLQRQPQLVRARSPHQHAATLLHYVAANGRDDDGWPLWEAIKFEYADAAERLARCGARLDNLVFAAAVGDLDRARSFLPAPATGWTGPLARDLPDVAHAREYALIFAAAHGRRPVVELLLCDPPPLDLTLTEPFWGPPRSRRPGTTAAPTS